MMKKMILCVIFVLVSCASKYHQYTNLDTNNKPQKKQMRWIYVTKIPDWFPDSLFQKAQNVIQIKGYVGKHGGMTVRAEMQDSIVNLKYTEYSDDEMTMVKKEYLKQNRDVLQFLKLLQKFSDYSGEELISRTMCFESTVNDFFGTIYFCRSGCFLVDAISCQANLSLSVMVDELISFLDASSPVPLDAPSHVPPGKNAK